MDCTKCGAPLEETAQVCPVCGEPIEENTPTELTEEIAAAEAAEERCENAPAETPAEEGCEEAAGEAGEEAGDGGESAEETEEAPAGSEGEDGAAGDEEPAKKRASAGLIALIVVLALAVGVVVFLLAGGTALFDGGEAPESYIYEAEDFTDRLLDRKIATCGDKTLTNRMLTYYYWREFYSLVSSYGGYISYVIQDPYARLDTQLMSDGTTWDQEIMEYALDTYSTCAAAVQRAEEEGFELPASAQVTLDSLGDTLQNFADTNGFASVEEYLQLSYGPYATLEDYRAYLADYYLATAYLSAKLDENEITPELLSDYYDEHEGEYQLNGLAKDDTKMVSVRHILISPEDTGLTAEDEGYEEAQQEAMDAARAYAEDIYNQWQSGAADEELFSALATTYSTDPGSASNGGLYEDVYPGQTATAFNDWCFDESREPGDTGIVETEYGYHIMYFSSRSEYAYWETIVEADYQNDCYNAMVEELTAEYPTKLKLKYAAVYPCNTEIQ